MTKRDQSVKTYSGTPPTTAFGSSQGTPIVIDYVAATGYFMHPLTGAVTALGGGTGGTGTVTSVSASGTIVTGTVTNPTTTPNIALALANTTVTPGSYTSTNLTVDAQGRITAAANGSSGGLINWAESVNTAAPNTGVPAVRFITINAATNVDAIISAKGTGAFMLQQPDGTSTGGNKRGASAVDLQTVRSGAAQVASGTNTALIGCDSSTATGFNTLVAGGSGNVAAGNYTVCLGGTGNNASLTGSVCLGGGSNIASNNNAVVMGGSSTSSGNASFAGGSLAIASANRAFAFGDSVTADAIGSRATGAQAITRGLLASRAHAGGKGGFNQGDAQELRMTLVSSTTDATPTVMTSNKSGAGTTNQYVLADSMSSTVRGIVTSRTAAGVTASWEFVASIKRGAGAASTVMVTACTPTLVAADAGAATWTLGVAADTTNGALKVTFTGSAAAVVSMATMTAAEVTL